jgi:hypothetical protein
LYYPPYPIIGWLASGLPTAAAERFWYSLPEPRSKALYYLLAAVATLIYPISVAIAFWVCCRPLRATTALYPSRTVWLVALGIALSVVYFVYGWRYGKEYQGLDTLGAYILASTALLLTATVVWYMGKRRNSWSASLVAHAGFFIWLTIFAFPWLGEMP